MKTPIYSLNGRLAVSVPKFDKIESRLSTGGIAINATRSDLIKLDLVFSHKIGDVILSPDREVVLAAGDSGLKPWAKKVYEWEGQQFVLMPEAEIIGYTLKTQKPDPTVIPTLGTGL